MKKAIRTIIKVLDLHFEATQYEWGRKLFKGPFFLIYVKALQLKINPFWCNYEIKTCQAETLISKTYK